MAWWEIAVIAASAAFLVFVGFGIRVMLTVNRTLDEASKVVKQTDEQLKESMGAAQQLMKTASALHLDLQQKLQLLEPLFEAAEQTGHAAASVTRTVSTVSRTVEHTLEEASKAVMDQQDTIKDIMALTSAAMQLWQRWSLSKSSRNADSSFTKENH